MDEAHTAGARLKDVKPPVDGASVKSSKSTGSSSKRSSASSVSAAAARARAKAEAARARVLFAQREISIKVDKARLEASLEALNLEKEAAAAIAQAEVLEAAAEVEAEDQNSWKSLPDMVQKSHERVSDYIKNQTRQLNHCPKSVNSSQISEYPIDSTSQPPTKYINEDDYVVKDCWPLSFQPQPSSEAPTTYRTTHISTTQAQLAREDYFQAQNEVPLQESNCNALHPNTKLTFPQYSDTSHTNQPESSVMMNMAKYLARKELVSTGLSHFDDCPESYRAWKSAFFNTIKDLDLTASEQLDLISKWLGKESSEYVKRLRAVHIDNPIIALKMTWDRLDEYYGAPEVIESALFKKLDSFPKITNKDNRKLRELGDLLMELLSAKEDGYLPGLAYLDTARGIKPILEKLPYNLQEKWITQGSKYKEDHKVGYPPFSFFTSFICYQAKTRNDPSFAFFGNSSTIENPNSRHIKIRTPVSVHKTRVSSGVKQNEALLKDEVAKLCPIHNKPHPLKKCRGFRLKTIDERKAYLKDQGICFKCCSSTTHLARDCKVILRCDECDSEKHITALHPGPPQWSTKSSSPVADDGGGV
ncbi:uncharacterized protein LOC119795453 [Cyprinodon tularosa]|uniref:uncharacterized protein LOC119795453 n=1 Tax=Cyprinodon tularosa TaxID=77115 RepID=UPI0018E28C11|nr:uncharacterized protein LOC119795453 [Cyprinodon tularosa]